MLLLLRRVGGLGWGSLFCLAAFGCGTPGTAASPFESGTLELALSGAGPSGVIYRLRQASFQISGTAQAQVSSEDDPDAVRISVDLPSGDYLAQLEDGWQLESAETGMFAPVRAVLTSPNPAPFHIADQQVTAVPFRFSAGDQAIELGQGRAVISLEIDEPGVTDTRDADADGVSVAAGDCNDTDASVHPGAAEVCGNGVDDDCDGQVDEDCFIGSCGTTCMMMSLLPCGRPQTCVEECNEARWFGPQLEECQPLAVAYRDCALLANPIFNCIPGSPGEPPFAMECPAELVELVNCGT